MMSETFERRNFLGMSKRSFCLTLAVVLLGLLVGAAIDVIGWLSAVDFLEGSSLLKFGREHPLALSWIRFCAYTGMLAGMVLGCTKWLLYQVNPPRETGEPKIGDDLAD